MFSRKSRALLRDLAVGICVLAFATFVFAQEDPDPNSPTPILLSIKDSTRALAIEDRVPRKFDPSRVAPMAFAPDSKVVLFVTNLDLIEGEGANAFRIYVQDTNGHSFRFPVIDMQKVETMKGVYALTTVLTDDFGYWAPPSADGDLLIGVTWRGLISNRVKLGLGQVGGKISDDPGAKPTPWGTTPDRETTAVKNVNSKTGKALAPEQVGYRWSGDRMRFLEQATFGPNSSLDTRVRRIGLRTWLAEQFEAPYPSAANPYPNDPLKTANIGADNTCDGDQTVVPDVPVTCARDTYSMYKPQSWFFKEAYYGDAQLKHRVAWALSEIWVTSGNDIQQGRQIVEYHKILSNNAFGNYKDIMTQMTLNPTMGEYLSMNLSTKNSPNENYAREIMQLFTVGLFMLNTDGTVQTDVNGPIPSYDQNTVNDMTKVFTGWSFCDQSVTLCPNKPASGQNFIDPMLLNPGVITVGGSNGNRHDLTQKNLLVYPGSSGTDTVLACTNCTTLDNIKTYANASMAQAINNIFNHPNLGPFVSRTLIQHLVTGDPTPAYVGRVAAVFNNNGFGVRGDLKAVVKAILLDPEARGDVKTDPNYGKLREPIQFATNLLRTFNVRSADGLSLSDGSFGVLPTVPPGGSGLRVNEFIGMAQTPFISPTVFNFFPPGYIIPGTTLNGPEFAILTTGTAIQRANFVNRMVFSTIPVNNPDFPNGTSLDFSEMQGLVTTDPTGNLLLDELNRRMMHGTMSATMRSTILTAFNAVSATDTLARAKTAMYLVATSSQYQVQR